ncbi:MAG: Spy/CpxP family protein refolding chaperone [Silvibacterium sp.]|nr:Spy/CpxP family protein refolding chaperone [Silvibacterium sp.]
MFRNNWKRFALVLSLASLAAGVAPGFAQDGHGPGGGPPGPPPLERAFHGGGPGRWWDDPNAAQQIGITDDQKKKMDEIFQQNKPRLIDLKAALEKQETIMHPLIEADQPDEAKILSQIDAIAQARAELEKANARMLLSIRTQLTPDQWKKVRAMAQAHMESRGRWGGPHGEGHPGGPAGTPVGPDGGAPPLPPQ